MAFVGCGECGGYFELEPDESFYDFDYCWCGGKLLYYQTYQDILDNKPTEPTMQINNNIDTLQEIEESEAFNFEEETIPSKNRIINKINFVGIFSGLCMFISLTLISYVLCFEYLYNTAIDVFNSTNDFYYTLATLGFLTYFIIFFISVSSSGMVTFIGRSKNYTTGFINGILFGLIILLAITCYIIINMGFNSILMMILIMGTIFITLCAFGGISGIFIRKILFPNRNN